MAQPSVGQMRFAQLVLQTEMRPRRRRIDPTTRTLFDGAILVTFIFFLFM
jgi:hypothetical protein